MTKKNIIKLEAIFKKAKSENKYITSDTFIKACGQLEQHFKDYNARKKNVSPLYVHMDVSRSGMMRTFNFMDNYNLVANVIMKKKVSFLPVKIGGCGMDMLWHTLFTCISVITDREKANNEYNGTASHITKML